MQQHNNLWLANFFNKQKELIEAAETPFAKFAVFILPILAPSVPAAMTGLHLYQLFLQLFVFSGADLVSAVLAVTSGIVLELLGYVGATSFIKSLFDWLSNKSSRADDYLFPMLINFFSYVFYLGLMFFINVKLGEYFKVDPMVNTIIAGLSFITVPTSLLAANHLYEILREDRKQKDEEVFQKETESEREWFLQKRKVEHEMEMEKLKLQNPSRSVQQVPQDFQNSFGSNAKTGRPSVHEERVFAYLEEAYGTTGKVPTFTEVVRDLGIPDSTASRIRKSWVNQKQSEKIDSESN